MYYILPGLFWGAYWELTPCEGTALSISPKITAAKKRFVVSCMTHNEHALSLTMTMCLAGAWGGVWSADELRRQVLYSTRFCLETRIHQTLDTAAVRTGTDGCQSTGRCRRVRVQKPRREQRSCPVRRSCVRGLLRGCFRPHVPSDSRHRWTHRTY